MIYKETDKYNKGLQDFFEQESFMEELYECAHPRVKRFDESFSNKDAMKDVVDIITKLNIKNKILLIGGIAVNLNGFHRSTKDLDFIIIKEYLNIFNDEMINLGYESKVCNNKHGSIDMIRFTKDQAMIDLVAAEEFYQKNAIKNEQPYITYNAKQIRYASIKTIIEMKLKALGSDYTRMLRSDDVRDIIELINIKSFSTDEIDSFIKLGLGYNIPLKTLEEIFIG